jgi:hypothetical protein
MFVAFELSCSCFGIFWVTVCCGFHDVWEVLSEGQLAHESEFRLN